MNPVAVLRKDHEMIEMELSELDFIMKGDSVNYSNLVHTFWKVCKLWDLHELKEEELFAAMKKEGFEVPIETILLEHGSLRERVKKIEAAINSGSDFEVRKVLAKEMREFVDVLRKHAEDEDDVLAGVIVGDFSDEGVREIKRIVGKYEG
ncbi:hemerythrin domain-containing protein [archaeon]|nr:hemerythrin domain-containing protein [archaeon]